MSKTDKTRPWWVQMADAPLVACKPVHDHRFGPCTLPEEITAGSASLGRKRAGCYWGGTQSYWVRRCESKGYREWSTFRRQERRRSRHEARRALHLDRGENTGVEGIDSRPASSGRRRDHAMDSDSAIRAAIEEHWRASEAGETETEHAVYAEDAILDYPQSGERFRGRAAISAQRGGHPAERHFTVLRITGGGSLWVSECIITYDGAPSYSVSIMEFAGDRVTHETQYFADPFPSPGWRAALAEPMPGRTIERA